MNNPPQKNNSLIDLLNLQPSIIIKKTWPFKDESIIQIEHVNKHRCFTADWISSLPTHSIDLSYFSHAFFFVLFAYVYRTFCLRRHSVTSIVFFLFYSSTYFVQAIAFCRPEKSCCHFSSISYTYHRICWF